MHLNELIAIAEQQLDAQQRVELLLDVAKAVLPALRNIPRTLSVVTEAISFARAWNQHQGCNANELYAYANHSDHSGLAFEEKNATGDSERAAVIASTSAFYYAIWLAYTREGETHMPQDVEAVPYEAFLATFQFAIASGAVKEEVLHTLLEHYLATRN